MTKYTVKSLMSMNPTIIGAETTLADAARQMERIDCGVLPVGTPDKLVGVITDRDIALRAVAKGKDTTKLKVSEIMTNRVFSISEDADLEQAADIIKRQKVNRLIVRDNKGKLTGIFSLSCLIRETADSKAIAQFVEYMAENHRKKAA